MTETVSGNEILQNCVFIKLSKSRLGNTRKADKTKIQAGMKDENYKAQLVLFVSDEYAAINTHDSETDAWLQRRAIRIPLGMTGTYVLPRGLLEQVDRYLTERTITRDALIDLFFARAYDQERENARSPERLNGQFQEAFYPEAEQARKAYRQSWRYMTLDPPQDLPPEIRAREEAALQEQFSNMAEDVRQALREGLGELTKHLAERLQTDPDTGAIKGRFYNSNVSNLVEFLDLFGARNVTRDDQLARLVAQARGIIADATPDSLKSDVGLRERVRNGMQQVTAAVDTLIRDTPRRRRFDLDSE